jgi:hypothetical protein
MNVIRKLLGAVVLLVSLPLVGQLIPPEGSGRGRLPEETILVKGAAASASDSRTPLPEDGGITDAVYHNPYLGLRFPLPAGWTQPFTGPPPSDSGAYVLLQAGSKGKGTVLITVQDLFFSLTPAGNTLEMIGYTNEHLPSYYKVVRPPEEVSIAGRPFVRFDYASPVAGLQWSVLATEVRCHLMRVIYNGRDTELLESLIRDLDKQQLIDVADAPACVAGYARGENVVNAVNPAPFERKFNPIPVRIIISKNGKVSHVHVISAFPDQAKAITEALLQWRFKPYIRDGQPVEVETGIMFGSSPHSGSLTALASDHQKPPSD